jgi:uncharacterized tellurite resistance protein B-like protein
MFEILKRVFAEPATEKPAWAFDDPRLAIAVLMLSLAAVDGRQTPAETGAIRSELARRFDLADTEIDALTGAARTCGRSSTELQTFAAGLARRLPLDERRDVVESLFRIAFSDGALHEFEDDLLWRIADLLGVPGHERVAIRKRLEAEAEDDSSTPPRA